MLANHTLRNDVLLLSNYAARLDFGVQVRESRTNRTDQVRSGRFQQPAWLVKWQSKSQCQFTIAVYQRPFSARSTAVAVTDHNGRVCSEYFAIRPDMTPVMG